MRNICKIKTCDKFVHGRGYCVKHYTRVIRYGDPSIVRTLPKIYDEFCLVCPSKEYRRGYCQKHYARVKKYGNPFFQKINSPGMGSINKDGYKRISANGKRYLEHRYIMEQYLGRPLSPREHTHHRNGNKLDNRVENLELISSSKHPQKHRRFYIGKTKRECSVCRKIKPFTEFALSGNNKRKSYCKKCRMDKYHFHIT